MVKNKYEIFSRKKGRQFFEYRLVQIFFDRVFYSKKNSHFFLDMKGTKRSRSMFEQPITNILELSNDLLMEILRHLNIKDVCRFRQAAKSRLNFTRVKDFFLPYTRKTTQRIANERLFAYTFAHLPSLTRRIEKKDIPPTFVLVFLFFHIQEFPQFTADLPLVYALSWSRDVAAIRKVVADNLGQPHAGDLIPAIVRDNKAILEVLLGSAKHNTNTSMSTALDYVVRNNVLNDTAKLFLTRSNKIGSYTIDHISSCEMLEFLIDNDRLFFYAWERPLTYLSTPDLVRLYMARTHTYAMFEDIDNAIIKHRDAVAIYLLNLPQCRNPFSNRMMELASIPVFEAAAAKFPEKIKAWAKFAAAREPEFLENFCRHLDAKYLVTTDFLKATVTDTRGVDGHAANFRLLISRYKPKNAAVLLKTLKLAYHKFDLDIVQELVTYIRDGKVEIPPATLKFPKTVVRNGAFYRDTPYRHWATARAIVQGLGAGVFERGEELLTIKELF